MRQVKRNSPIIHFKSPKIGKLNIDTLIIGLLIHEKTQTKKSHATVPLRGLSHKNKGGYCYISIKTSFQGLLLPIIKFYFCTGNMYCVPFRILYISYLFCINDCLEGGRLWSPPFPYFVMLIGHERHLAEDS